MNHRDDLRRKAIESVLVGVSVAVGAVLGGYAYSVAGVVAVLGGVGVALLGGFAWGYVLLLDATDEADRTERLDDTLEEVETDA